MTTNANNLNYLGSYGLWHVTTEGDCEGRSIRDLGVHEGHLDDIAFALADQVGYGLRFSAVDSTAWVARAPRTEVHVSLDPASKTWGMKGHERRNHLSHMLSGRDVTVEESDYYASTKLVSGKTPEGREKAKREAARKAALAKLSAEDRQALGLE